MENVSGKMEDVKYEDETQDAIYPAKVIDGVIESLKQANSVQLTAFTGIWDMLGLKQ